MSEEWDDLMRQMAKAAASGLPWCIKVGDTIHPCQGMKIYMATPLHDAPEFLVWSKQCKEWGEGRSLRGHWPSDN